MSRFVLRTVFTFLLLAGVIVFSFSCVCSPSECEEISEEDCPAGGGTVWDPCKCCRICARTEGEPCGGPHGFHGTCAKDLDCVVSSHASGKPVLAANSEGICTRHPGSRVNCKSPSHAFGCNIIDNQCFCERVYFCSEDSPFMFATEEECEVNLVIMLQHELADVQVPGTLNVKLKIHQVRMMYESVSDGTPRSLNASGFQCIIAPVPVKVSVCLTDITENGPGLFRFPCAVKISGGTYVEGVV